MKTLTLILCLFATVASATQVWFRTSAGIITFDDSDTARLAWARAKGYTQGTPTIFASNDCVTAGGTWTAGACVMPPTIIVTNPPVAVDSITLTDQATGLMVGFGVTNQVPYVWPRQNSPWTWATDISNMVAGASDADRKSATLKSLKNSPEYTGLTNKLVALDNDYSVITGQVATINWSNSNWTNKLQNILDRNNQLHDDQRDALKKAIKLIKDIAGNQ
ncbi:MAG: hypothetical protein WCS70_09040 [Verrucomicrobiota bacterium]